MSRQWPAITLAAIFLFFGLSVGPARAAGNYKVLHWFSREGNGSSPESSLVLDPEGNLYGSVTYGGVFESGNIFKLVADGSGGWTERELYNFCSGCAGGANPNGNLILDSSGSLYGVAGDGGGSQNGGVAFRLSPGGGGTWSEQVLYDFCATEQCPDGEAPVAGLVFDGSGNLYGTTTERGQHGYGAAFQLVPQPDGTWTENVLYSFCALSRCEDGQWPFGTLILDSSGNLYGTTASGGAYSNPNCSGYGGCGTVFELTPTGSGEWTYQILHSFNYRDGAFPGGGLIFDDQGRLYGTAERGGPSGNGLVFELTPSAGGAWTETVLHSFDKGGFPVGTLVFDQTGNLYGAAAGGGTEGVGIVFKLTPSQSGSWTQSVLHSFTHESGYDPEAGVILDTSGNLYGTAAYLYAGYGVVYEITQ
jgi:uncharacterized repeat protein (TIGR03803 family)